MILHELFYRIAFVATGFIHLHFNDLIKALITTVALCLSDSKRPIVQSIVRLHSVVLTCFVVGFCFNTVTAYSEQTTLGRHHLVFNFDEIETPDGFGNLSHSYHGLLFHEFFAFDPAHPNLRGLISADDLNCAVSKPNALYGSKVTTEIPSVQAANPSYTFAVYSLKIKPLDVPVGAVTINIAGSPADQSKDALKWAVDFPAGFHDVLVVDMEKFTKVSWTGLRKLEVWAEFHYHGVEMPDWEFCIDDLDVEIEPPS